ETALNELASELDLRVGRDIVAISGAARQNLTGLLERLWLMLHPVGGGVRNWSGMETEDASPHRAAE
ncbi:MAG: hypothetical protein PSX37_05320, partial [bacterium]|nr:hypothetical protein [bacterium]